MKSISRGVRTSFILLSSAMLAGAVWADDTAMPTSTGTVAPAATATPPSSIEVLRAVLTFAVANHDPAAEINAAKVGNVVIGWCQIGSGAGAATIHHKWLHEGKVVADVPLTIPTSPYRTWSSKTITDPGAWTWQITTDAGDVLKEVPFTVSQ